MNRRLGEYRQLNKTGTGNPILIDFFTENEIEPHVIDCGNDDLDIMHCLK